MQYEYSMNMISRANPMCLKRALVHSCGLHGQTPGARREQCLNTELTKTSKTSKVMGTKAVKRAWTHQLIREIFARAITDDSM